MPKCKAIQYGKCVGTGIVAPGKRKLYCTSECRYRSKIEVRKYNKKLNQITTPSGCNITATMEGRCEKAEECFYYSDCLKLIWDMGGNGFTSDGKGFYPNKKNEIEYWQSNKDILSEHVCYIKI